MLDILKTIELVENKIENFLLMLGILRTVGLVQTNGKFLIDFADARYT